MAGLGGKRAGAGRPPGKQNKLTIEAKDLIAVVAKELGGADRLLEWCREDPDHESVFWERIYVKLLPLHVGGVPGAPIQVECIHGYRPSSKGDV